MGGPAAPPASYHIKTAPYTALMFAEIGWEKLSVLFLLALLALGPQRLPSLAREAGRMLRDLVDNAREAPTRAHWDAR